MMLDVGTGIAATIAMGGVIAFLACLTLLIATAARGSRPSAVLQQSTIVAVAANSVGIGLLIGLNASSTLGAIGLCFSVPFFLLALVLLVQARRLRGRS